MVVELFTKKTLDKPDRVCYTYSDNKEAGGILPPHLRSDFAKFRRTVNIFHVRFTVSGSFRVFIVNCACVLFMKELHGGYGKGLIRAFLYQIIFYLGVLGHKQRTTGADQRRNS